MLQHLFVRHVATDKNMAAYDDSPALQKKVKSMPTEELPVNQTGRHQGDLLADSFADYLASVNITGPITFIHSGFERAETTLSYLLASLQKAEAAQNFSVQNIIVDERVRDIDQGDANDLPYETVIERWPEYKAAIDRVGYLDAQPPGGESHRESLERIRSFISDLGKRGDNVTVITHFSTLVLIRWALENLSDEEVLKMLSYDYPPNGSVTRYQYDPRGTQWSLAELYREPWSDFGDRDRQKR